MPYWPAGPSRSPLCHARSSVGHGCNGRFYALSVELHGEVFWAMASLGGRQPSPGEGVVLRRGAHARGCGLGRGQLDPGTVRWCCGISSTIVLTSQVPMSSTSTNSLLSANPTTLERYGSALVPLEVVRSQVCWCMKLL